MLPDMCKIHLTPTRAKGDYMRPVFQTWVQCYTKCFLLPTQKQPVPTLIRRTERLSRLGSAGHRRRKRLRLRQLVGKEIYVLCISTSVTFLTRSWRNLTLTQRCLLANDLSPWPPATPETRTFHMWRVNLTRYSVFVQKQCRTKLSQVWWKIMVSSASVTNFDATN